MCTWRHRNLRLATERGRVQSVPEHTCTGGNAKGEHKRDEGGKQECAASSGGGATAVVAFSLAPIASGTFCLCQSEVLPSLMCQHVVSLEPVLRRWNLSRCVDEACQALTKVLRASPSHGSGAGELKPYTRDAASMPSTQNKRVQLREVLDGDARTSVLDPDHHMLVSDAVFAAVLRSTELRGKYVDFVVRHDAK